MTTSIKSSSVFAVVTGYASLNLWVTPLSLQYMPVMLISLGGSLAALAVLTAVGSIYVAAFIRQLMRGFGRFAHNAMAAAADKPVLPPIPANPRLPVKTRRTLRQLALISLSVFAASFVLGMITSMLSAHAVEFWHAWGWFGYTGWH